MAETGSVDAVVAGHICLDIIPDIGPLRDGLTDLLVPGKLFGIGAALTSTGGCVPNTGLALHRLGVSTQLMGKVGDDMFGSAILDLLRKYGSKLAEGMIISENEHSSYTIVISPSGMDRMFLHCTGANDTFVAEDLLMEPISRAKLFHFGYPPLMMRMYVDGGMELKKVFKRVKAYGATTSLDMAKPDPMSAAGMADWRAILRLVLPYVDLFLPSLEELLFMLEPHTYETMEKAYGTEGILGHVDGVMLSRLSDTLLGMGAGMIAIKLGVHGLYVRTSADADRFSEAAMGRAAPNQPWQWADCEFLIPCFQAKVAGTTGAGDCTIAGFLAALLKGLPLEAAAAMATAVGACSVERADAVSGVPPWSDVLRRIEAGWTRKDVGLSLAGWTWDAYTHCYRSPRDLEREQTG